ncbi:MAG: hypothetical protein ABR975_03430 [Vulcanimicrobiaceae bacterium]|jgi:hypothetical protein
MTRIGLVTLAAISVSALAACSGGATTPTPTPATPKTAPSTTPQTVAKASGTLTIKFSHIKSHLTAATKKGGAAKRSPKFVDPNGTFLEISSFDASGTGNSLGVYNFPTGVTFVQIPNNAAANGTMTVTVPIVASSSQTNVYVYEVNDGTTGSPPTYPTSAPSYSDVLSFGEGSTSGSAPAGSSGNAITVTLQLAPAALGAAPDPTTGEDGSILSSTPGEPTSYGLAQNGDYADAYIVGADLDEDVDSCYFAIPGSSGYGGMPLITLVSQSSDGGGTSSIGQSQNGAWIYYPDPWYDSVYAEFQTSVGPFPNDGYVSQVLPQESTYGYADFYCYDCGDN